MPTSARPRLSRSVVAFAALSLMVASPASDAAAEDPPESEAAAYRILVTNDDGIDSPGLAALVEALSPLGEVTVVAPLENQSGVGHALNLRDPIFMTNLDVAGRPATALTATPATCVRVAIAHILEDRRPDLVVAGVNRGLNFGRNAYISGTVAAAREAALQGIPAIAISLARQAHPEYAAAASAGAEVVALVREHGLPAGIFLNVNAPATSAKGLKLVRQSRLAGTETYEARQNPYRRAYLWSVFKQPTGEPEPGTDVEAVRDGYIAVTPLEANESAEAALESLAIHFGETEAVTASAAVR